MVEEIFDVNAEAEKSGLLSNVPDLNGIVEIREWIDDSGVEINTELVDIGKILKASPSAAKKLYADHQPDVWSNNDILDLANTSHFPKKDHGNEITLNKKLEELEQQEIVAEEESKEFRSKGIVGKGWKKGFLDGSKSKKNKTSRIIVKETQMKNSATLDVNSSSLTMEREMKAQLEISNNANELSSATSDSTRKGWKKGFLLDSSMSHLKRTSIPTQIPEDADIKLPSNSLTIDQTLEADSHDSSKKSSIIKMESNISTPRKSVHFSPKVQEREIPAREPRTENSFGQLMTAYTETVSKMPNSIIPESTNGPLASISAHQVQQQKMSKFKMRRLGLEN